MLVVEIAFVLRVCEFHVVLNVSGGQDPVLLGHLVHHLLELDGVYPPTVVLVKHLETLYQVLLSHPREDLLVHNGLKLVQIHFFAVIRVQVHQEVGDLVLIELHVDHLADAVDIIQIYFPIPVLVEVVEYFP